MKPFLASAAAVVSLLALAGCGDEEPAAVADPAPARSTTPAATPTAVPTGATPVVDVPAELADLFPESELEQLGPGRAETFADGTRAGLVTRGGRTRLEVTVGGTHLASPALRPDSDTPYLWGIQLELGQAGPGWVVGHEGGDSARLQVYVVRAGRLVVAEPPARPSLGDGFTASGGYYRTWPAMSGTLHTRVPTATDGQFRLFTWEVTGPGEGGGAADGTPRLVARELGRVCITETATRYSVQHC